MIAPLLFAALLAPARLALLQSAATDSPGQLECPPIDGKPAVFCPLEHTSVNADVAGFGARVSVVQTFKNPSKIPIEAIYTFPLPHDAAVDKMRIKVGERIVDGMIRRRDEARTIYEAAKAAGQTAGLLDQERPNIFTQSVANIMPGTTVQVQISYVQMLKYENGQFEFTFPMVVGPRYLGNTRDPEKISPPLVAEGYRTGATEDLAVHLDAGAPIVGMSSVLHQVDVDRLDDQRALVTLQKKDEIPNRDFILHYRTATDRVQSAFLTTYDAQNGGFFDLILLPPKAPKPAEVAPREMIFVMDQSGSQRGFPLEKSKELTFKLLKTMRPDDTFNVYGFNLTVRALWSTPQPVTPENLAAAHRFLDVMDANSGTNLLEGMRTALSIPKDPERLRVVMFNTDGFVGDEADILQEIKKDRDQTRIFTFGIGNSVNRYLIDAMSLEGKGDSEIVTLSNSASEAADRFVQRLRAPVLTDVSATVEGLEVADMVPQEIPDVFSDRPIVIQGRYQNPGVGQVVVSGRLGGQPWQQTLKLRFGGEANDSCVATLWARKKVDDLTDQATEQVYMQEGAQPVDYRALVTDVGLQFGIMTPFTSFVAVAPQVVNVSGVSRTVHVPVEMADGVSYYGIVGNPVPSNGFITTAGSTRLDALSSPGPAGGGGGFGGGRFGGGGGLRGGAGGGRGFGGAVGGSLGGVASGTLGSTPAMKPNTLGDADSKVIRRIPRGVILWNVDPFNTAETHTYQTIVDPRLRAKHGKVAIVLFMSGTIDELTKGMLKGNLTVWRIDSKRGMIIGECDATILRKLAEMKDVKSISPAE